jgi:hypothetical protein
VDGAAAVDEQSGIVERLAALLDTSLIRRVEGHSGRLAMFETVAEYARERNDPVAGLELASRLRQF